MHLADSDFNELF